MNIDLEKDIVQSLSSLYPLQEFEERAIDTVLNAIPHWIPVTERLPKPRESVIISVNGKYGDWIGEGCYWETTENHVIWKGYRWNATYWDDEIIAWMPLPEPYKGATE